MKERVRAIAGPATVGALAGTLAATQPTLPRGASGWHHWLATTTPDLAVVTLVTAFAWLCLGWLTLATALVAAARLPGVGGRCAAYLSARVTPLALRRVLEAALGAAVVTGALLPAPPASADGGARAASSVSQPVGTPSLDRPVGSGRSAPQPARVSLVAAAPHAEQALDGEVVVRPGDTLWDLAARHLGPGAGDAQIAAAWPEWWHVNRAVVGTDPNLIHPGQRLRPPR